MVGAWLTESNGKVVISPDHWVNDDKLNKTFMVDDKIIPDRWIKLPLSNL